MGCTHLDQNETAKFNYCTTQAKIYQVVIVAALCIVFVVGSNVYLVNVYIPSEIFQKSHPKHAAIDMDTVKESILLNSIVPKDTNSDLKFSQLGEINSYVDDEDLAQRVKRAANPAESEDGSGTRKKKKKTAMIHLVPKDKADIPFRKHYNFWMVDNDASHNLEDSNFAVYQDGGIKIKRAGIYLIYAQISYQGRRTRYAYQINKNGDDISRCVVSEQHLEFSPHSGEHQSTETFTQCKTSIAVYLKKHDSINIKDLYNHVSSHGFSIKHQPENTYFGLVRLS